MNKYDYRVQNPVDLSKLFLLTNMTHYKDINDSCDSSAVLGLIVNILDFPLAVRTNAEKVGNICLVYLCIAKFETNNLKYS